MFKNIYFYIILLIIIFLSVFGFYFINYQYDNEIEIIPNITDNTQSWVLINELDIPKF